MGNASSIDAVGSSGDTGNEHATSAIPDAAKNPSDNSSPSKPATETTRRGNFNPHVTIQTLGSASTALDDGTSGYTYYGVGYATNEGNPPGTVGDALASSITRDLNPSTIGGQIVGIQRLWPGSGRMMRSYRLRIRVPRMNSATGSIDSNAAAAAESLPFTIELACKSFIVRSERGENPLKQMLTEGDAELKRLRTILSDPMKHPHILSYARWIVGPMSTPANVPASPVNNIVSRPIHLLRQHAHASLSDRLVSRPFFTLIEKNWITFQLLNAIQSLHDAGICHGHITTENVLLTSWNWVVISDVGCQHYKPVALPDDDPGLWIHWFEGRGGEERKEDPHHSSGNGEKKCCLAPERFYTPGRSVDVPTKLTPAMDTFSLGCVLIELFLNGERALDLGDLMEYRKVDKEASSLPQSLKQKLDKIESSKMRAACRHMLSLDPSSRLSPNEYLERLSSNISKKTTETAETSTYAPIPPCFKTTLLPFVLRLRTEIQSPDVRIALVACNYSAIVKATVGVDDEWGAAYFSRILGPTIQRFEGPSTSSNKHERTESSEKNDDKGNTSNNQPVGLSNLTLDELLFETESLMKQLDSGMFDPKSPEALPRHDYLTPIATSKPTCLLDNATKFVGESSHLTPSQASIIVILQVVFSSVRHVRRTSSKFVALKLMHRIALFSSDEIRLQRIVPFVTSLLQDSEPIVRASGISVLTSVLSMVTTFPPSDAQLFPDYVFKKVAHLITDASLIVRVAFARSIATLSETSLRFLEIGHSVALYDAVCGTASRDGNARQKEKAPTFSEEAANLLSGRSPERKASASSSTNPADTSTVLIRNTYDSDLGVLHEVVLRWVVHITTDTSDHSSQSKQALLSDLPRLCSFFGAEHSFQILPQILAFFNDRRDWQLRASVLRHLPSVCVAVGRAATEQFVVPCIESALNDDEEQVVNEALACLSTLIATSLLSRTTLLGTEARQSSHRDGRPRREKEGVIKKTAALLIHPLDAVRKNAASFIFLCWKDLGETNAHAFAYRILQPYLRYSPCFESLQHFMACLKIPDTTLGHVGSPTKHRSSTSNINAEIEFSVKLARILSVPSQWFKDSSFVPSWYELLNTVASANSTLSDPSFSLGIRAFEQVYGISIFSSASISPNQQMITSWVGDKNLAQFAKDNPEVIANFLSRQEFKILESSCRGEWGSFSLIDQSVPENCLVNCKLQALSVPPLSPRLGNIRSGFDVDLKMNQRWAPPKEDTLIASTSEHSGPVTRLAVSGDQAFFVSASFDGTARVFELSQIKDSGGDLRSCLTYDGHNAGNKSPCFVRVNDVSILENSHSVASAASDGSMHVWRIDTVTSQQNYSSGQTTKMRVSGNSVLRHVNPCEGEVMAVSHFNTSSASILTYATQRGVIHSMDLRCPNEPFSFSFGPEYGYLTALEVGKEKSWIAAGSSRGYVGLFDIRFQSMVKLWRHSRNSPVHRLANASDVSSWPLLFMGCDNNEVMLFDASNGECRQCYRVLEGSLSYIDQAALPLDCLSMPYLENIEVGKAQFHLDTALQMSTNRTSTFSINALIGSVNRNGLSHLITAGSDSMIRYWDLGRSSKSFCVTGLSWSQPPPCFDHMDVGRTSRLYICQQPPVPPTHLLESSKMPLHNRQGIVKCDTRHSDSILDLKVVNYHSTCLLSSSRDGTIKLWG